MLAGSGSCHLVIAGGQDMTGRHLSDVWLLDLSHSLWSSLPTVSSGLQRMAVCGAVVPLPHRLLDQGLVLFGPVRLRGSAGQVESSGTMHGGPHPPKTFEMCLAACSLERQIRTQGSISPRTQEGGRGLGGAACVIDHVLQS